MEILIGEPIIMIYESGVCTSNDIDTYLGRHVYGWNSPEGPLIAGGMIESAKYVVPTPYWNYDYMLRDNNGKIDRRRFLGGYTYDDFLVDKVVDIENEELQNICWWKEKTEPSIKHILEFYSTHKIWDKFVDISKYMTKEEIVHSIFGDGNEFNILKDRIDSISRNSIEKCRNIYNEQDDKEKAREFIFDLLGK